MTISLKTKNQSTILDIELYVDDYDFVKTICTFHIKNYSYFLLSMEENKYYNIDLFMELCDINQWIYKKYEFETNISDTIFDSTKKYICENLEKIIEATKDEDGNHKLTYNID